MPDFEVVERRVMRTSSPYVTDVILREALGHLDQTWPEGNTFDVYLGPEKLRVTLTVVMENTLAVRKLTS